ncbi:MAG: biotin--[acetyl-CoA-carboxylase] ligase [Rubrivivax sp.]
MVALRQHGAGLEGLLPGLDVQWRQETGSTNDDLLAAARAGDLRPTLLVAERQTAGRGRSGRRWQSAAGDSLTFSLSLPYAPADWSGLSLAVGLAVAEALDETPDETPDETLDEIGRIGLKWPNDLWLREPVPAGGRKLAGVLIETVPAGSARVCVIGVGLNIRPNRFEGLDSGSACLQELQPQATPEEALGRIAPALCALMPAFEQQGFAPLAARFAQRDLLRGRAVTTTLAELPDGVAQGVDAQGALLVRGPDGRTHRVVAGEVSVRPARMQAGAGAPSPQVAP